MVNLKKLLEIREFPALLVLILMIVISTFLSEHFLTSRNISNLLVQVSIIAVLAAGETYVILTGGIDLSVGSVAALSGALTAGMMKSGGMPVPLAICCGLATGVMCGLTVGLLVTKVKIPSFVATLAMMTGARGLTLLYTAGIPISLFPESFLVIASRIGPISVLTIIMIAVYLIGQTTLSFTKIGRYIHAIGGNEDAVRFSGIRTDLYKCIPFIVSGLCAGLAGIMIAARLDSAYPTAATGYELDAIASTILGGTTFTGGVGSLGGTFMGALIMTILGNLLNLLRVSPFYQYIFKGLILVLAAISLRRGVWYAK